MKLQERLWQQVPHHTCSVTAQLSYPNGVRKALLPVKMKTSTMPFTWIRNHGPMDVLLPELLSMYTWIQKYWIECSSTLISIHGGEIKIRGHNFMCFWLNYKQWYNVCPAWIKNYGPRDLCSAMAVHLPQSEITAPWMSYCLNQKCHQRCLSVRINHGLLDKYTGTPLQFKLSFIA